MRRTIPLVLAVAGALFVGCAEVDESKPAAEAKENCGSTATDDCTPVAAPNGKVRVDALTYRLLDATTSPTIGDTEYGFGETANGVYVILTIKVKSNKDESATLTDSVFKLDVGGNTYDPDNSGTVAAVGDGQEPFFFETIGPDSTLQGQSRLRRAPASAAPQAQAQDRRAWVRQHARIHPSSDAAGLAVVRPRARPS